MAGVLLRSGSVKHFLPLGATGNPVYSAASQLRAAIRRHLSPEMADYFAIPKQDEKGETIDWYSAFDGNVVPWTAATPEERCQAKTGLLAAQRKLREKSATLQRAEDSEQQVFGKLLELATCIPGDDHVYLVDGRPVMTFWGFSGRDGPSNQDVLAGLDTGGLVGADQGPLLADAAATQSGFWARWLRWPWLLLPLLLLLLGLLLLGLRGCLPDGLPRIAVTWPEPVEQPAAPEEEQAKRSDETADAGVTAGEADRHGVDDRTRVDRSGREVVEHSGRGAIDVERTVDGSSDTRVDVDRTGVATERNGIDATDTTERTEDLRTDDVNTDAVPDTAATDDARDDVDGKNGDAAGQDGRQAANEDTSDAGGTDRNADQGPPGTADKPDLRNAANRSATTRGSGAPLVIPRDAAKKGTTDFMNGAWRSVTGLQDAAGNPVQLEYDFKGGAGTATLRRSVGGKEQVCTAAVRPAFQGSKLVIDQAEDIRCPDGSTFQRSSVECTTDPQGRATCKGKNRDGSDYQVRINKK